MSAAEQNASCRQLARVLLRTEDPKYAGLLDIVAYSGGLTSCIAVVHGDVQRA